MTSDPDQDLFSQAGDYALGLLTGEEKQVFEAALARDPELKAEVARCYLHFEQIGVERDDLAGKPLISGLLWRELWGENWMPWRRRMRLWEFALGGIAAGLVAYGVYQTDVFGTQLAPGLQARLSAPQYEFELQALLDPTAQTLHVEWRGTVPEGGKFVLWAKSGEESVLIGELKQTRLSSFKLSRAQLKIVQASSALLMTLEEVGAAPSLAFPAQAQGILRDL